MACCQLAKIKWLIPLIFLSQTSMAMAQGIDIEGTEKLTDEGITEACHGFVLEMFSEQTEQCKPNKPTYKDNGYTPPEPEKRLSTNNIELGEKQEANLDITIECKSEYMCMEQRVKLRKAGHPISQTDYNRVAQHCENHYACIEYFFRDWPKPIPQVVKQNSDIGLTFDELAGNTSTKLDNEENVPSFSSTKKLPNSTEHSTTSIGFDGLEQHRMQAENTALANQAYSKLYKETFKKSLLHTLDKNCKEVNLNFRTPGSPRSIREDMRYMESGFKKYANCYQTEANKWDAQAYANSLNNFNQEIFILEQKYNTSLAKKKKPSSIDKQVSTMQQRIEKRTQKLKEKLKEGPRWIESLYASGTYKRPNSGVNTMAILSQTLTQLNNSLAQQNQQRQAELNRMLNSVNQNNYKAPQVNVPKVHTPKINTPNITVPKFNNSTNATTLNNPTTNSASISGALASFACHAPSMQVCLFYKMPSDALQSYRQRCKAQGNKVLNKCPGRAPSCEMKNFAGSVTTYNYDLNETQQTKSSCLAGSGTFREN